MAIGIFLGVCFAFALLCVFVWKTVKRRSTPSEFELAQDMRRFAHGFFHAPPAEQTERIDIFRESAASYRRQGLSPREYARSAALIDTSLEADERKLLHTVTANFVTGD